MSEKIKQKIFISLFALLYLSVALVSTYHAIYFFGLANVNWIAIMLAITFEIGQAAVLFSILTNNSGKTKVMPWILMCVLTLVQVLGNVYSSYKYLITNSPDLLQYFKEPIFVWMELPDNQCNVILTYIIGAILPIVSLLMTGMVTNFIGGKPVVEQTENEDIDVSEEKPNEEANVETEPIEQREEIILEAPSVINEPTTYFKQEPVEEPKEETHKVASHFINI